MHINLPLLCLGCGFRFPSCLKITSDSEEYLLVDKMAREPIYLNVYDMVSYFH